MKKRITFIGLAMALLALPMYAGDVTEERWENGIVPAEQTANPPQGIWNVTTYVWGYLNDASEQSQGYYSSLSSPVIPDQITYCANPFIKGENNIEWSIIRTAGSVSNYVTINPDANKGRTIRLKGNYVLSSAITNGIKWITIDKTLTDGGKTVTVDILDASTSSVYNKSWGDFVAGTPFDTLFIPGGYASDFKIKISSSDRINIYGVIWESVTTLPTSSPAPESNKDFRIENLENEIVVNFNPEAKETRRIGIYNTTGALLHAIFSGDAQVSINKRIFVRGVYILRIESSTGQYSEKLLF